MEINSYQGIPTTCKVCLKPIKDNSERADFNSAGFNADLVSARPKLSSLYNADSSPLLCYDCYATRSTTGGNKECLGSPHIRPMLGETTTENKTELLTYKFLSDILKEEHVNGNNQDVEQPAPSADVKQTSQECLFLKDVAIFNPTFLNSYMSRIDTSIDYLSGSIKQTGFGGLNDKHNVDLLCHKLGKEELTTGGHVTQNAGSNSNMRYCKSIKLPHKCSTCGFTATNKSKLMIHMATHTKEKPCLASQSLGAHNGEAVFKCDKCEYETPLNSELTTHVRLHTGNKPYKCTECEFKCSSKSYLNVHMRIHTGETPYKCDICGYSTSFKYTLSVHMRTHTGVKPYRCTECDFRCSTKGYLETHTRIHTGETPYKCNICGYNTTFKYTLSVHMRTHLGSKPYQCRECDFKCSSESYFKKHLKIHSGEFYTCSICPYTSTCRSTVTHHMKTHTGEKPFKCTKCDYRAYKKYDVRKHMKMHTQKPAEDFTRSITTSLLPNSI